MNNGETNDFQAESDRIWTEASSGVVEQSGDGVGPTP